MNKQNNEQYPFLRWVGVATSTVCCLLLWIVHSWLLIPVYILTLLLINSNGSMMRRVALQQNKGMKLLYQLLVFVPPLFFLISIPEYSILLIFVTHLILHKLDKHADSEQQVLRRAYSILILLTVAWWFNPYQKSANYVPVLFENMNRI